MKNAFLIGENIHLRPIRETDLNESYQSWFNDAEICQYNDHHRFPNYPQDMEEYFQNVIKSRNHVVLAIADKKTDIHIGNISLQDINLMHRSAEFAIIIGNRDFWGKGVGKEAGALIIEHGFKELNLNRIFCGTSAKNLPMQKLAGHLGFVQEGISRQAMFKHGVYEDVINYGLLRSDYEKN